MAKMTMAQDYAATRRRLPADMRILETSAGIKDRARVERYLGKARRWHAAGAVVEFPDGSAALLAKKGWPIPPRAYASVAAAVRAAGSVTRRAR